MTTTTGRAQSDGFPRGGPKDWSHSHLVGCSFVRDGDRNLQSDWRTHVKSVRLERMAQRRALMDQLDILDVLRRGGRPKPAVDPSSDTHLDWNLRTGGLGNVVGSPAKFSFDIGTANCSDVIYFTVDQAGAAATPNVIAITNAYANCPNNAAGTTPTVKWGIRMTSGTATSPVPSLDGKVLYVLENSSPVKLDAINVDNITTGPGTYSFTAPASWSDAAL